ncbi:MerR family transcriptional regulator [Paenibacillus glufosinatiresistens]|uniref:MerR family transcriptional regulator n=1 Tax=Paenibacillus glufosinatiresistens TaxID=3070657 RepID=UPI00286DBC4A|nr:MerR family transcriptional regulator [Paenibacillus sp. YX.27]
MEILSLNDFCASQRISKQAAKKWINRGMPVIKMSKYGRIYVDAPAARAWLEDRIHNRSLDGISLTETARIAGVHPSTVRYWARKSLTFQNQVVIPERKAYRFSKKALFSWLESRREEIRHD